MYFHLFHLIISSFHLCCFSSFSICLKGMGCFRDLWWAGMEESAPLTAVVRRIRRALAENEIPFDKKRFSPHITLIRKAAGTMPGIQIDSVSMPVKSISLMRSDRGKRGMIYTEVGEIRALWWWKIKFSLLCFPNYGIPKFCKGQEIWQLITSNYLLKM